MFVSAQVEVVVEVVGRVEVVVGVAMVLGLGHNKFPYHALCLVRHYQRIALVSNRLLDQPSYTSTKYAVVFIPSVVFV